MTSTLCAATFSNSYFKWRLRYVMLRFVAAGYSQLYQNKLHFLFEFMKVVDPKVLLYSYKKHGGTFSDHSHRRQGFWHGVIVNRIPQIRISSNVNGVLLTAQTKIHFQLWILIEWASFSTGWLISTEVSKRNTKFSCFCPFNLHLSPSKGFDWK